jgi:two-component system nitrate/nitrite sensor histidine kinase NarX
MTCEVAMGSVIRHLRAGLARRATLALLIVAFLAVTVIGVVGMSASVLVSQAVHKSVSAVNVAGGLRRLALRVSSLVMAEALGGRIGRSEVRAAMTEFEHTLVDPALREVVEQEPGSVPVALYRGLVATWYERVKLDLLELSERPDGVILPAANYEAALAEVDAFIEEINALVAVLEQDAYERVRHLRTILAAALLLTGVVVVVALYLTRRRVFLPLAELRDAAGRIAQRNFSTRCGYTGKDELGQVGAAFNFMAAELSNAYLDLERRVEQKTADLTRSNHSLDLLYRVIARLYHAPASADSYREALTDIECTLGLKGCSVCVHPSRGGPASLLHSNIGECVGIDSACVDANLQCPGRTHPWTYLREGDSDVLRVPLRDKENFYGVLRLALHPGQRLEGWQQTLVEALSRHMAIALGISRQTERERLISLQEERSIIARELHDSLAQALSYMKIQVSLLQPLVGDPQHDDEARELLQGLRQGINSAYRQLRELLSSFRLKIEGDFTTLLEATVEEFSGRSGIPISVDNSLPEGALGANQEIHVLHIIREALSNATRHSGGKHIAVTLSQAERNEVVVMVDDDGTGLVRDAKAGPSHHGLTIMGERARGLGGRFEVGSRAEGGTRVSVRFDPAHVPYNTPISDLPND